MKSRFQSLCALAVLAISGTCISTANAQVGAEWTEIQNPSSNIQIEAHDVITSYPGTSTSLNNAGGHYTNSGGIETFSITDTTSNRVERRYLENYNDARQFQADILISSPTNNESIHQVFNGPTGPWLIVRESNGANGEIRMGGGTSSSYFATNLYGTWFRLNSINIPSKGTTQVYYNGTLEWTGTPPSGTFYTKYGCYGTLGAASAKVQFKNVHLYQKAHYGGKYKIIDSHSGKAVVVQGASLSNSAPCILYTFNATGNDEWNAIELADGHYEFQNVKSNLAMVVQSASTAAGAAVVQYTFGGTNTNDEWDITDLGNGSFKIINVMSGLALDVKGAGTTNGTVIDQAAYTGASNQQFQLVAVP